MRLYVDCCMQAPFLPAPALKFVLPGSQAMSPAATTIGSPAPSAPCTCPSLLATRMIAVATTIAVTAALSRRPNRSPAVSSNFLRLPRRSRRACSGPTPAKCDPLLTATLPRNPGWNANVARLTESSNRPQGSSHACIRPTCVIFQRRRASAAVCACSSDGGAQSMSRSPCVLEVGRALTFVPSSQTSGRLAEPFTWRWASRVCHAPLAGTLVLQVVVEPTTAFGDSFRWHALLCL